jgi:aspartate kinase
MIVMKFGGSSVESAAAIERVAGIVREYADRKPFVVVSAMGKTTNKLLACANLAAGGRLEEAWDGARELERFHETEAHVMTRLEDQHDLEAYLKTRFAELRSVLSSIHNDGEVSPMMWDEVSSFGERLSSYVVTLAFRYFGLRAEFLDARQVIVTDSRHMQALPLYNRTYAKLLEKASPLLERGVVVMGGFIGSTADGVTSTLGRGGSDFSASIVGAGLGAEEIQIWTDVDGMLTCDPRIQPGGHLIKVISFSEAAELAYFGAKVLHPATVLPAVEKNIPVRVLNSRRPHVPGTLIVGDLVHSDNPVKSIACKRGITIVNIQSLRMLMAHGFLRRIFEVFDRYRTPVDMVTTSEVSVSLTIDDDRNLPDIEEDLRQIAGVNVVRNQAIVCLVGEAIRETPGVSVRVFTALKDVNIRMISQGASLLNISIVLDDSEVQKAVAALHGEFFSALDPDVFEEVAAVV